MKLSYHGLRAERCGKCGAEVTPLYKVSQEAISGGMPQVRKLCGHCEVFLKFVGRHECKEATGIDVFLAWEQNELEELRLKSMASDTDEPIDNFIEETPPLASEIPQAVPTSIGLYYTEEGRDIVKFAQALIQFAENPTYTIEDDKITGDQERHLRMGLILVSLFKDASAPF